MGFKINPKHIGMLLILLSMIMFILFYNFSSVMLELIDGGHVAGSCSPHTSCPHLAVLNQTYIGYTISLLILIIGIILLSSDNRIKEKENPENIDSLELKRVSWKKVSDKLDGDEKKIYENLIL